MPSAKKTDGPLCKPMTSAASSSSVLDLTVCLSTLSVCLKSFRARRTNANEIGGRKLPVTQKRAKTFDFEIRGNDGGRERDTFGDLAIASLSPKGPKVAPNYATPAARSHFEF